MFNHQSLVLKAVFITMEEYDVTSNSYEDLEPNVLNS